MTNPDLIHHLEALEQRLAAIEAAAPEQIEAAIDAHDNTLLRAVTRL